MDKGDYVRIRWGNGLQTISKCKNIVDIGDTQYAKDDFYIHTDHSGEVIYKTMIVKSSPNIIDLIEVGDFIGKTIVEEVKEFDDGTRIIVMADGFDEYDENEYFLKAGIVTKEQFESMEYKIGE